MCVESEREREQSRAAAEAKHHRNSVEYARWDVTILQHVVVGRGQNDCLSLDIRIPLLRTNGSPDVTDASVDGGFRGFQSRLKTRFCVVLIMSRK